MQITDSDFLYYFNSIMAKGKKDNTYKFALARFLLDYSYALDEAYIRNSIADNKIETINLSFVAKAFKILLASDLQIQNKAKLQYRKTTFDCKNHE